MKKLTLLLLPATLIIACNSNRSTSDNKTSIGAQTDTLKYETVTVANASKKVIKGDNQTKDSTYARIQYPVFHQAGIDTYIQSVLLSFDNPKSPFKSAQEMSTQFVANYEQYLKEDQKYEQTWFLNMKIAVYHQTKDFVVLRAEESSYTGGAHPNSSAVFYNYNLKTQKKISLIDLFGPNAKALITPIAEKIFRKNEGLKDNDPLKDKYFFDKDKFAINDNFAIGREGIVFYYNPYEIKPYAEGPTTLTVPFAQLTTITPPNGSIIEKYLK